MNQNDRRSVVCNLVETMRNHGSWAGETHIQKSALLLQEMCEVPLGYRFVLYIHGPFSFDLRSELTEMRVSQYLDVEPRQPYGPSFNIGFHGKPLVNPANPHIGAIEFIAKELAGKDTRSLERVSTAFFIQQRDSSLTRDEIAEKISRLKPHIPIDAALRAVGEVDELRQKAKESLCIYL